MKLLLISNELQLGSAQSAFAENLCSIKHDDGNELILMTEGISPENEKEKYHYALDVEDLSIPIFRSTHSFLATLSFVIRKAIYKYLPRRIKHLIRIENLKLHIEQIARQERLDGIVIFVEYADVRIKALARAKGRFVRIAFFTELPCLHRYDTKIALNTRLLDQVQDKIDCFAVRAKDIGTMSRYSHKIIPIEFPSFRHTVKSFRSKKGLSSDKNLIFLGAFHERIREPFELFRLMKNLSDYKLLVYGPSGPWQEAAPSNVLFLNPRPLDEIADVLNRCVGFVNISNNGTFIRGSKEYTYFSYGKPVISFNDNEEERRLGLFYGSYLSMGEYPESCVNDSQ